jgi:hypothetical protein
LHKEGLYNLYSLSNINKMVKSKDICWVGHVARNSEMISTYRILVGSPSHRGENNMYIDLKDIEIEDMERIYLAQYKVP